MSAIQISVNNMSSKITPPTVFGPQWWKEGRKWGSRSTPCRLYPVSDDVPLSSDNDSNTSYEDDFFPPRRDSVFEPSGPLEPEPTWHQPAGPEPTWQEMFHNLNDLLTGNTEQNRKEVSFEQVGILLHALNPPRSIQPVVLEYKEPSLSEYELARQKDLEDDKAALITMRETQHENRKKLKELMAKQDEIGTALQKKEDEWNAEQERQKKVYRPRYLAAAAPATKPAFRETQMLESVQEELLKVRHAMNDYQMKVNTLKHRIEKGEAFMVESFKNLEILRDYRKFEHTLVGDYI